MTDADAGGAGAVSGEELERRIRGLGETVVGLSWEPEDRERSLEELFHAADAIGTAAAGWYARKCRWKRRFSLAFRASAIALVSIGGLLPLLNTALGADTSTTLAEWGYVCLAVAGACVGANRFFGVSSSWIRFISAHLKIQHAQETFRFQWGLFRASRAGQATPPEGDVATEAIQRMLRFVELVHTEVERETETWAKEFMSALADLEKLVRSEREGAEPGAVRVTLENAEDVKELRVLVDGVPGPLPAGKRVTVPRVPPGQHSIEAHGVRDGKPVGDAALFTVSSDSIEDVELDLS